VKLHANVMRATSNGRHLNMFSPWLPSCLQVYQVTSVFKYVYHGKVRLSAGNIITIFLKLLS